MNEVFDLEFVLFDVQWSWKERGDMWWEQNLWEDFLAEKNYYNMFV